MPLRVVLLLVCIGFIGSFLVGYGLGKSRMRQSIIKKLRLSGKVDEPLLALLED